MNLCHVHHTGANTKYYEGVLAYLHRHMGVIVTKIHLSEFIENGTPKNTDILSYQTFPDEFHKGKFNARVIYQSDAKFHSFSGRKVLVDIHDSGDVDAFSRMYGGKDIPRVKCYPTQWFLDNYNVVLVSSVSANPGVFEDSYNRTIKISCKFGHIETGFYGHPIRETVIRYLNETFRYDTDFNWIEVDDYFKELRWTKIVIGAPGWGRHNASYWGALKAGALLFAHRSLNDSILFPHADLIDGEDFVSYDLFNFKTKLRRILHDEDEMDRIRNNGRRKFAEGLNYKKSALQFIKFLKGG